jgi:hypothetical protein
VHVLIQVSFLLLDLPGVLKFHCPVRTTDDDDAEDDDENENDVPLV